MFGFIKNLISGIMKFITGLFPGKKKGNGYYLELKEEAENTPPVAKAKSAADKLAAAAKSAANKVSEMTESEADKAVAANNGAKQLPASVAAPETSNGAKEVKKPSGKTSVKSAKKLKQKLNLSLLRLNSYKLLKVLHYSQKRTKHPHLKHSQQKQPSHLST